MIYPCVLADFPWQYRSPLKMKDGVRRFSADQYKSTMTIAEGCDLAEPATKEYLLRIAGHDIADDAILFFWITGPLLLEGAHLWLLPAWGFSARQVIPWVKGRTRTRMELLIGVDGWENSLILQKGLGFATRGVVEYLIIAARGTYTKLLTSKSENGLILSEQDPLILASRGAHSAKPAAAYELIERVCVGPRLELFARTRRAGWTAWGDEVADAD